MSELYENTLRYHLGPVASLFEDPTVSEVLINGPDEIYCERGGKLEKCDDMRFEDDIELMAACTNIAQFTGNILGPDRPRIDGRLPDGSRVHIVLPPLAPTICLAIRRFQPNSMGMADLIGFGALNHTVAQVLKVAVGMKKSILVSGGTGSGKTTFLNALSGYVPQNERIISIEDIRELKLLQPHVVSLQTRPPDAHGRGEVSTRDLLESCLRMRPDRILIGEVRGGEALDLLNALNSGHGGTMCSLHANSAANALSKLETLVLFAGEDLPQRAIRSQIANAVDMVVQMNRLSDGSRRLVEITEIGASLDVNGNYQTNPLFEIHIESRENEERLACRLEASGNLPSFFDKARAQGFDLTEEDFGHGDSTVS
jgi:pilus assembly protein CpaF